MNKAKFVISHCGILALVLCLVLVIVTLGAEDVRSQLASQRDGIEIILIDVSLSRSAPELLCKSIKAETGVRDVNSSTVESSAALDYVKTIQNYTFSDYLNELAAARDAELVIVSKPYLEAVLQMKQLAPLGFVPENADELCIKDGQAFAFPFKDKTVTEYSDTLAGVADEAYGVLINGDHIAEMREFLLNLNGG